LGTRIACQIDDRGKTICNILSGIHDAANELAAGSAAQQVEGERRC
jgi:hypothetical protein